MSKKPNLIYFLAIGDFYYREMVKLSILSIITNTNYSGDIIVLSDDLGIPTDISTINNRIQVLNIFTRFPSLREKIKNKYNIFCMKSIINRIIDITHYNFIQYFDGDILVKINNLDSLFNFWADCGLIQIADHDGWDVSKIKPSTGSQFLSETEIEDWKGLGFCAGVLGFPGNKLGVSILEDWYLLNKSYDFEYDDQGALTSLLLRKYQGKYVLNKYCNNNWWILKNITHYHGGNKKIFWEHCKFMLRNYQKKPSLSGRWQMEKPSENIKNIWEFDNSMVFVSNPQITGTIQETEIGIYIWWNCFEGFEKIKKQDENTMIGASFRGGEGCFSLTRIN